ncbi:LysE family translocator [Spirosoma aerolatum]|uniref:LysE family translocator n=1 Tax=Spirosoma aerolatum TaxID=1211326 RepID=UPI0009AD283C|nr:LysE family translocator [Spirosoma aerolatum]
MFGIDNYLAFLLAGILLNITPGSDTLYILGRSLSQGKQAGIYSALGISAGCFFHSCLAAFGLSAIIAESQLAFDVIKYTGAAYLVYLGLKMLLHEKATLAIQATDKAHSPGKLFVSGALTNILNPKAALFFLAFLPQFVQKEYSHEPLPFLVLGLTFTLTGTLWCLLLALFSASLSHRLKQNPTVQQWFTKATGSVFILLGLKLTLEQAKYVH